MKEKRDEVGPVKKIKRPKGRIGRKIQQVGEKIRYGADKAKNSTIGLGRKYMETARKSIRHEILNLVIVSGVAALVVGMITTGVAKGIGIGRYEYEDYNYSSQWIQERLSEAVKQLNTLDYMDITYEINPYDLRSFFEEYSAYAESAIDEVKEESQTTTEKVVVNGMEQTTTEEEKVSVELQENTNVNGGIIIPREDGTIREFQRLLNRNVVGRYNGQEYRYNDEWQEEEVINEEVRQIYDELATMVETNRWEDSKVHSMVEGYYKKYSNKILFKDKAVRDILKGLDNLRHSARDHKTYLLDSAGNVLYNEGIVKTIDIVEAIKKTTTNQYRDDSYTTSIYPIILNEEVHYLFNETTLDGALEIRYTSTPAFLGWMIGGVVFVFLIFKLTAAKIRYIEYLSECLDEISKGNLDYDVEIKGEDELAKVASTMKHMERELKKQIEERMQAEQTKNELITNVAHDLRTPLTSIIGYIGLVKDKKYEDEEECTRYLDIAYSKSERLKVLIEDLFEYTKLSNRAGDLKLEHISASLLMNQLVEELRPQAEEKNLRIVSHIKEGDTSVFVDVMKMARVFENLIENAIKYSMENEDVQTIIQSKKGYVYVTVRNRCKDLPEGDISKLFDRFYRTDMSRNSTTGGSGLGLAIAKNIVEMHQGKIWAQLDDDRISFNVKLKQV